MSNPCNSSLHLDQQKLAVPASNQMQFINNVNKNVIQKLPNVGFLYINDPLKVHHAIKSTSYKLAHQLLGLQNFIASRRSFNFYKDTP